MRATRRPPPISAALASPRATASTRSTSAADGGWSQPAASHRRNRVRAELLPLLESIAQRDVVPVLARQSTVLRAEAALLDALAEELDPTDARSLAAAPPVLARRAVRGWLADGRDHPPDLATVERVLAVARGEAGATDVGGGRRVVRSRGRLTLDAVGV